MYLSPNERHDAMECKHLLEALLTGYKASTVKSNHRSKNRRTSRAGVRTRRRKPRSSMTNQRRKNPEQLVTMPFLGITTTHTRRSSQKNRWRVQVIIAGQDISSDKEEEPENSHGPLIRKFRGPSSSSTPNSSGNQG